MAKGTNHDVITFDAKGATRLDNGMLRAPVTLSRVGVFNYRMADGSTRRDLRLPEEVFAPEAMASFELVPFLDEHPYADGGVVMATNAKRLQIGSVGTVTKAGAHLDATVMITDEAAVGKVLSGKVAVSCGYLCDREFTPGVYTDAAGKDFPYDCIQRNIRGNHVALVSAGRAGPEARIRLDADDSVLFTITPESKEVSQMEKIVLDSLPAEMPAQSAAIVTKAIATRDATIATLNAEVKKLTADAQDAKKATDTAQATLDATKAELVKASDPVRFADAVAARVALESKARQILGAEFKMTGDAKSIKVACVSKLSPDMSLDAKSDDYVNALFDHLSASAAKINPASEKIAGQVKDAKAVTVDSDDPFEASRRRFFNPDFKA